jgi:hypothetical protein
MNTKTRIKDMDVFYRLYEIDYLYPKVIDIKNQLEIINFSHQNDIEFNNQSEIIDILHPNDMDFFNHSEIIDLLHPNDMDVFNQSEIIDLLHPNDMDVFNQSEIIDLLHPNDMDVFNQPEFFELLHPNDMDVFNQPEILDAAHQKNIDLNNPSEIIEDLHEKICEQLSQNLDPSKVTGVGHTLFIGYDCEWVEKRGCLQILSYQFYLVGIGGEMAVVFLADERLAFKDMLDVILMIALQAGIILHYPHDIVITGYFLRADLAMLSDFIEFKGDLSNISGSVGNAGSPLKFEFSCSVDAFNKLDSGETFFFRGGDLTYSSKITFYDLANHAPEKTSLSVLGDLLGIEKLTVPNIAEMDKLREQDSDLFIDYGIRDAEIVVKYYLHILEFSKNLLDRDFGRGLIPATAGSLAVSLCKRTVEDFDDVFGLTCTKRKVFDGDRNCFLTKKGLEHTNDRAFHEPFVAKFYHGGMNICYYVGPTDKDIFFDYDLSGAYTTGMIVLRTPDYEKSFESKKIKDFLGDLMGFALVHFTFPPRTKFPCLPVKSLSRDGLYYPLEGESFCTAPELTLAVKMGAKLVIKRGVIYPWKNEERIFQPFVQKIRALRKQSIKGSFPEQYAKLIGNSLYGKTGQGVKAKTAFDTRDMKSIKVPESGVTNAAMVAHVTGFIRAVMGEIICGIPKHRLIVNCVTDGILTNAREDEIDLSGELCQRFQSLMDDGSKMLEVKHEVKQVLSIKTRGVATLIEGDNPNVKSVVLAKTGVSLPDNCEDANGYIVDLYLNRQPQQKVLTNPFVSVRDQWIQARDVLRQPREITLNFEYDFKRRPVNRRMIESHVAFNTVPWNTIDEIDKVYGLFSNWKQKHCIKTLEDFDQWEDLYQTHLILDRIRERFPNRRLPLQITEEGSTGLLKRLFLRAYNKRCWGMDRPLSYSELTALMNEIGFSVTVHDAKNGNKGQVYDNLVPCTVLTKSLVKKLKKAIPELDVSKIFID